MSTPPTPEQEKRFAEADIGLGPMQKEAMSDAASEKEAPCPNCMKWDTMHIQERLWFCPRCVFHFEFPLTPQPTPDAAVDFDDPIIFLKGRIASLDKELAEAKTQQFEWAESSDSYSKECDQLRADLARVTKERDEAQNAALAKLGDDYCWLDNVKTHLHFGKIPPKEEFLKSCEAYHAQITAEKGVLPDCKTMRQLIEENASLTKELADEKGRRIYYQQIAARGYTDAQQI